MPCRRSIARVTPSGMAATIAATIAGPPRPGARGSVVNSRPMARKPRAKDLTRQYLDGAYDDAEKVERLDGRQKAARKQKIADTAQLRQTDEALRSVALPLGQVRQVFSLYQQVRLVDGRDVQTTIRKTLNQRNTTTAVVGDVVRVREQPRRDEMGPLEGVIEHIEPRRTLLTRADSFKAITSHPIVANADQMLIVVSVAMPRPKWGLVDRMLVAASGGGLLPVVCLNKIDLGTDHPDALQDARAVLAHYRTLGHRCEETCATQPGSEAVLAEVLAGRVTVLAGHSGVGKSSLVRRVAPELDIRVGDVSTVNEKGKHTTTSARLYDLPPSLHAAGVGQIIDTPGVKLFGLWGIGRDTLDTHFPDVAAGTAPAWRAESYERIRESLPQ